MVPTALLKNFFDSFFQEYEMEHTQLHQFFAAKDVLLIDCTTHFPRWQIVFSDEKNAELIISHLLPNIEEHLWLKFISELQVNFSSPLKNLFLTNPYFDGQDYHFYVVMTFNDPLFPCDRILNSNNYYETENNLSRYVAKKIRELRGKGPRKVRAILLHDYYTYYSLQGLLTNSEIMYLHHNQDSRSCVEEMLIYTLRYSITAVYYESFQIQPRIYIHINSKHSEIQILVIP